MRWKTLKNEWYHLCSVSLWFSMGSFQLWPMFCQIYQLDYLMMTDFISNVEWFSQFQLFFFVCVCDFLSYTPIGTPQIPSFVAYQIHSGQSQCASHLGQVRQGRLPESGIKHGNGWEIPYTYCRGFIWFYNGKNKHGNIWEKSWKINLYMKVDSWKNT